MPHTPKLISVIKQWTITHEQLFALLIFSLLICLFFAPIIFNGKTLTSSASTGGAMSYGPYKYDGTHPPFFAVRDPGAFAWQDAPLSKYIGDAITKKHHIPLWNPNMGIGYPILGGLQIGIFYPPNWIPFLFSSELAWDIFILLKFLCAGFCSYLFARKIFLPKKSAFITGIIFMFSGYMMGFLNMAHLSIECLIPLILFSFESLLQNLTTKNFIFTVAIIALSFLPGMPEATFLALMLGCFWFFFSLYLLHKDRTKKIATIGIFILANLCAFALCSIQLLPFLELLTNSFNSHVGSGVGLAHTQLFSITSIFYPFLFFPLFYKWINSYYYCGIAALILSFLALVDIYSFAKKERLIIGFFSLFAILGLAKIFGLFFINWVGALPVLNNLIFYKYLTPEIMFSFAILAAYGYMLITTKPIKFLVVKLSGFLIIVGLVTVYSLKKTITTYALKINDIDTILKYFVTLNNYLATHVLNHIPYSLTAIYMFAIVIIGIFGFLVFGFTITKANRNHKCLANNLLLALIILELFLYTLPLLRTSRYGTYKTPPYINFLQQDKNPPFRVYSQSSPTQYSTLFPNTSSVFQIQDIRFLMAMAVKRYFLFLQNVVGVAPEEIGGVRFTGMYPLKIPNRYLDLLNVKYFLVEPQNKIKNKLGIKYKLFKSPPHASTPLTPPLNTDLSYNQEITIFKNRHVIPRVFIVHQAEKIQDQNLIFAKLKQPNFNYQKNIIVEDNFPSNQLNTPVIKPSTATITNYEDELVEINAAMNNSGFLVLLDQYYPGWKAYVDGKETHIYATDYAFRSIFLKKGNHKIQFIYDPLSYKIGKLISIITLLLLVGFIIGRKKFDQCLRNISPG